MLVLFTALLSLNGYSKAGEATLTKTFQLHEVGSLKASSSGGGIEVQVHNEPTVVIEAYVRKNGRLLSPSDDKLQDILENFELDFSQNGTRITAVVKQKFRMNFRNNNVGISLSITVPREMSCEVSSSGGGLKIEGVQGTHEFSSSGGGVELINVSGTTEAQSSGGGVKASAQEGDVRLSSSGGGVTVDGAQGRVYARSSGGSVQLKNIHGEADASSSGGGVTVSGELAAVKASSSGGSVRVDVSGLSKELDLESSGGGVSAVIHGGEKLGMDLDLHSDHVYIDLTNFSGKSEKNKVEGSMNGGGIPVHMHASGGDVKVSYGN